MQTINQPIIHEVVTAHNAACEQVREASEENHALQIMTLLHFWVLFFNDGTIF